MTSANYIGRFAPSPTGHLHFGSLLAAMASYCDARKNNGQWQLRIDDIDPPREMPNAAVAMQDTLTQYGFIWDGPVLYQSKRSHHYLSALHQLNDASLLFTCDCSRSKLANQAFYPGYCNPTQTGSTSSLSLAEAAKKVSNKLNNKDSNNAIRINTNAAITFNDRIQGEQVYDDGQPGNIVVVRRDDLFAYSLACAIDDSDGITHVVRGSDLLPTTASQLAIMECLGLTPPSYAHIPVARNSDNQKLSKQTLAPPLDKMDTLATLLLAWRFLQQREFTAQVTSVPAFWEQAIASWNIDLIR